MKRETSVLTGHEVRDQIGLQYFADGADEGAGSGTDGESGDAFLAALMGDELEDQQLGGADSGDEGGTQDGGEDQPAESAATDEPEQHEGGEPPEETPPEPPSAPPEMVNMIFNGRSFALPKQAVQAISQTLGQDATTLLQKGMNYENKASREMRLLNNLAQASGKDLATFLTESEASVDELYLERARAQVRAELPEGTPDEAIERLAQKQVLEEKHQREFAAFQQRQAEERAAQQRAQAEQQAQVEPWNRFAALFADELGIRTVADTSKVPQEVFTLVRGGLDPVAAMYKYKLELKENELNQKQAELDAARKNNDNRGRTPGSMQGAGGAAQRDPFLAALFADD